MSGDPMTREQFLERANERLTERNEIQRRMLLASDALVATLTEEMEEWKRLAMEYGSKAEAERFTDKRTLFGKVEVTAEMLTLSKGDIIAYVCADLAKRMRHKAFPPRAALHTGDA